MNQLDILISTPWQDYELLDSGSGAKLERFGSYTFVRPEPQAMWKPALNEKLWRAADAIFQGSDEDEQGSRWEFRRRIPQRWQMRYRNIAFWAEATPFRHMGVFPEHTCQWDWMSQCIHSMQRPINALNLFAYTGLSTLMLAAAGARVTHVDASKKIVAWARENQALSNLTDRPVRWIIDDALKFVQREGRRGAKYDALIIDPPKFGRGSKGEVWKLHESLPLLLDACREILSDHPLFVVLTTYAVKVSGLSLVYLLDALLEGYQGETRAGEMALRESSAGRLLATAAFARWQAQDVSK
jgi:23S rRNA (cytosine1962-C5)-methyltransferase